MSSRRHLPAILLLTAIATPLAAQSADAKAKAAIEASAARMVAAANRADADGVVADLTPDARVLVGTTRFAGREAFRAATAALYRGVRRQDIRMDGATTLLSPTSAEYSATGTFTSIDTSGASMSGAVSVTAVYRLEKGAWKVASFHESVAPTPAVAQEGASAAAADAASAHTSYQPSVTAVFQPVPGAPYIANAQLYGDANADAPHAEFTKFAPGADMGRHFHTNTVTVVVLKGAYLYRDDAGEKRVAAGDWLRIPGGKVHWSGADASEGAVIYVHMDRRMDQTQAK
ncbi:MAG TPA: SgcJ/EcaC family oxidoreductase [Gemmatimonadaceae bacterium]|nr:SgcJ/EcaC family oxidoreductase [Gemmatimonadaceae bacterium]